MVKIDWFEWYLIVSYIFIFHRQNYVTYLNEISSSHKSLISFIIFPKKQKMKHNHIFIVCYRFIRKHLLLPMLFVVRVYVCMCVLVYLCGWCLFISATSSRFHSIIDVLYLISSLTYIKHKIHLTSKLYRMWFHKRKEKK